MKIALLSFEYPPETGFGGIGTYTWYHARALVRLGHDVHVLAGSAKEQGHRVTEHDGVVVHRFRDRGWTRAAVRPLERMRLWWSKNRIETGLDMFAGIRALQRQHRFDVIEMPECGAEGLLVNHLVRTPTVVRFHSPAKLIMPYYRVRRADIRLCTIAEQVALRGASSYSSCSGFLADEVRRKLGVRRPVAVIPNGIDIDLFDDQDQVDFRLAHGIPRDRPVIFFAGRMERRKGIDLCRTIAAKILATHDVAFVMAGQDLFDIMSKNILPFLATQQLKGSFHYLGRLDLAAVRAGVCQSDIFLLPSLWENCPYSCLEAMAAGRAIVSTDQGGMPEMIEHGVNGLLARNGDAGSYIERLGTLLDDPSLRIRLGKAARSTVERRFTDIGVAQQSVERYAELS